MPKSELISLRVTPELRDRIKKAAEADNRTLNNYLLNLIVKAMDEKERPE